MEVFYSNRLEELFLHLVVELKDTPPLSSRLIVVPHHAMKTWLELRIADWLGIAMGFQLLTQEEAVIYLKKELSPSSQVSPCLLELSLAIEAYLQSKPTFPYLEKESVRREKRAHALSHELACLFIKYGRYSGAEMDRWIKMPASNWQQEVWQHLFQEGTPWTYPYRAWLEPVNPPEKKFRVDVFGWNFLSELEIKFLDSVQKVVPTKLWLISPCLHYWTDTFSDREKKRWIKHLEKEHLPAAQLERMNEILEDVNPLLANLGIMSRKMASSIEKRVSESNSSYTLLKKASEHPAYENLYFEEAKEEEGEPTLLKWLQTDMLLFRSSFSQKIAIQPGDESLQIHQATSKKREVEIVYECLMGLLYDRSIPLADIAVLAPDMQRYEPYIKMVFGAPFSQIPYYLSDASLKTESPLVQGFLRFLNFSTSRWEAKHLLELFENLPFRKKSLFDSEEIARIAKWAEQLRIYWGKDLTHQKEYWLKNRVQISPEHLEGSWDEGMRKLVSSLCLQEDFEMELSSAETAGKWILFLQQLEKDLGEASLEKTLKEWADLFYKWLVTYFDIREDEGLDDLLDFFQSLSESFKRVSTPFGFYTVLKHAERFLSGSAKVRSSRNVEQVVFGKLSCHENIPYKVVVCMGMQEEDFPRFQTESSLDLHPPQDFCPALRERDRNSFLQLLTHTSEVLVFTYSSKNASSLIQELKHYVDKFYQHTLRTIQHPYYSFDPCYFQGSFPLRSFSQRDYKAALITSHETHAFMSLQPEIPLKSFSKVVYLKDLEKLFRNPFQYHLNHVLNIWLKNEEDLSEEEAWEISSIEKSLLKKEAFHSSKEKAFKKLGQGLFADYLRYEMEKDLADGEAYLKAEGAWPLFKQPLPPLEISYRGHTVQLVGELDYMSSKGLVTSSEDFERLIPKIPAYLACASFITKPKLFCLKGKKTKEAILRLDWEPVLDYFFVSQTTLIPFMPTWVKSIWEGDEKELQKIMQEHSQGWGEEDPYLKWASFKAHPKELIEMFQARACALFFPFYEVWK